MSLEVTIARIAELHSVLAPQPATTTATPSTTSFAGALQGASAGLGTPAAPATRTATLASVLPSQGTGAGQAVLNLVRGEVGQAEQPPGSNDSARIAQYRSATAGAPGPGPWCAYFTSWLARSSGVPLGDHGQGFGSVDAVYAWAQKSGRAVPAASGQDPRPGDLIVWDEHIGVVESVLPDGRIQTIEGNSSDRVSRRVHAKGDALGYVRMS